MDDPKALGNMFVDLDSIAPHEENVREEYKKSAWNQPGSKFKSLHEILPELPFSKVWVEGCVGSGVITMNRKESPLEILNDRHAGITDWYRCVRDPDLYDKLLARLKCVLHSREEFIWSRDTWENCDDTVERAARWYYMIRNSFNQIGRNFGRSLKGEGLMPRKYWRSFRHFPHIHDRIHNAQIENMDVVQLIKDYDSYQTVFYIDPDYVDTDQGVYQHGVDHVKLLNAVMDAQGFVAVSGYRNDLYMSYEWDRIKEWNAFSSVRSAAKTKTGHLQDKDMTRKNVTEILFIKDYK